MYYAGFWKRLVAIIIDNAIIAVVIKVLAIIGIVDAISLANGTAFLSEHEISNLVRAQAFSTPILVVLSWLYFSLMESSIWQATLGKKIMGIIVTDEFGDRITFSRATGRHFSKYISGFIFSIGFIMAAFTSKKQALHDKISHCLVISNR